MQQTIATSSPYTATRRTRDQLIEDALPIVRRMAFRLARRSPSSVHVGDLIGAGSEGLIKAAMAYDPMRYESFEPYARSCIRGAMLDHLRSLDQMTRHGRQRMTEVSAAIRELLQELGQPPEEEQIAERLGMELSAYRKLAETLSHGPALSSFACADPDQIAATSEDPAAALVRAELHRQLAQAVEQLPSRSQLVLGLYYQEECTQAEIGEILGVTEGRVCQILGEAAARLRALMGVAEPQRRRTTRIGHNQRSQR